MLPSSSSRLRFPDWHLRNLFWNGHPLHHLPSLTEFLGWPDLNGRVSIVVSLAG